MFLSETRVSQVPKVSRPIAEFGDGFATLSYFMPSRIGLKLPTMNAAQVNTRVCIGKITLFTLIGKPHTSRHGDLRELEPTCTALLQVGHAKRLSRNLHHGVVVKLNNFSLICVQLIVFKSSRQSAQTAPPRRKIYQLGQALFLTDGGDLQNRADNACLDHSTNSGTLGDQPVHDGSKHPFSWWHLGQCHQDLALLGNLVCPKESPKWKLIASVDTSLPSS